MIFGLFYILNLASFIYKFSLFYVLHKKLNNKITIPKAFMPSDFEKYNNFIISGKINNGYIYLHLNLFKKLINIVYKDDLNYFEKSITDFKFYKTNKNIYIENNLLKLNIINENSYILEIQIEKLFINTTFSFIQNNFFEQDENIKYFNFETSLEEGIIINDQDVDNINNLDLVMVKTDNDYEWKRQIIKYKNYIYDIDYRTNLLYNDWSNVKVLNRDFFETKNKIYFTVTNEGFEYIFNELEKETYFHIGNDVFSFSY